MADREPFIKATEDLLGKENCAWMLTWKPMQNSEAFRTYCRGIGMEIGEYDEIAKNIDSYENDRKWGKIIEESKRFRGVVVAVSESPCSMLLYSKPVRKELGIVRTNANVYCCLLDGINCDKYKYLKNDYLSVLVWSIIRSTCELAGIPIPTIRELDKLLDDETFDIYKNKLTCSINQADSDWATELVSRYCPKSVEEMSAFVAIIRPGCAKLLQDFIDRKPYTTGVKALDDLLIEGKHRMIYQELIMKYLIWLGIPETGSYDIIKKISKKKFKEAELAELKTKLSKGWLKQVGTMDGFEGTWGIVQDAARYSFNSSHSLSYAYDSLYGAYLKSHYPLEYYTVALNSYQDDTVRTTKLTKELEYFDIQLKPVKFRYSRANYSLSREDNSIYKGIASIKNLNAKCAEEMYQLRNNKYTDFIELLYDIKRETTINSKQLTILIELNFFEEFGDRNYLLQVCALYDKWADRKTFKKEDAAISGIPLELIRQFAGKESEKQFSQMDMKPLIHNLAEHLQYVPHTLNELINSQVKYLGYVDIPPDPKYSGYAVVLDVDTKFSPKVKLHSLKNGTLLDCKINKKTFAKYPLEIGNVINIHKVNKKPKVHKNDAGKWVEIPGTSELWVTEYNSACLK